MKFESTKIIELGSCAFRQWKADSHCKFIHGYRLIGKFWFECNTLDERNWVMDFGGLKAFKEWSEYTFDHTLVVAADDPHLELFQTMASLGKQDQGGVADLRVVEAVGCEKFSELAYKTMENILRAFQAGNSWFLVAQDGTTLKEFSCRYPVGQGVKLRSVEVFEHNANSAVYEG